MHALPILLQGAAGDVAEYILRLRQLRWQSMAVRAEEDLPFSSQQASGGQLELGMPRGTCQGHRECMCRVACSEQGSLQAGDKLVCKHLCLPACLPANFGGLPRPALFPGLQELEAARSAPRGVRELGEEEMGQLAAAARQAGMEALFRQALGLTPAAGS